MSFSLLFSLSRLLLEKSIDCLDWVSFLSSRPFHSKWTIDALKSTSRRLFILGHRAFLWHNHRRLTMPSWPTDRRLPMNIIFSLKHFVIGVIPCCTVSNQPLCFSVLAVRPVDVNHWKTYRIPRSNITIISIIRRVPVLVSRKLDQRPRVNRVARRNPNVELCHSILFWRNRSSSTVPLRSSSPNARNPSLASRWESHRVRPRRHWPLPPVNTRQNGRCDPRRNELAFLDWSPHVVAHHYRWKWNSALKNSPNEIGESSLFIINPARSSLAHSLMHSKQWRLLHHTLIWQSTRECTCSFKEIYLQSEWSFVIQLMKKRLSLPIGFHRHDLLADKTGICGRSDYSRVFSYLAMTSWCFWTLSNQQWRSLSKSNFSPPVELLQG